MTGRRQRALGLAALVLAMAFHPLIGQHGTVKRPMSADDLLTLRHTGGRIPVRLSPDGQLVAYTVDDPARKAPPGDAGLFGYSASGVGIGDVGLEVWMADVKTGRARRITAGQGSSWGPKWSPDGQRLAFYSDRGGTLHVWLWDRATERLKQLSDAIPRITFEFQSVQWSGDGKHILALALPHGVTLAEANRVPYHPPSRRGTTDTASTVSVFVSGGSPKTPAVNAPKSPSMYAAELVWIDVATGKARAFAKQSDIRGFFLSPTGTDVVYTCVRAGGMTGRPAGPFYDVHAVSLKTGEDRVVVAGVYLGYGISVRWSPDGTQLAYTTDVVRTPEGHIAATAAVDTAAAGDVYVVRLAAGPARRLTRGLHTPFGGKYDAPLWSADSKNVYVIGDGGIWRAATDDTLPRQVVTLPRDEITGILPRADGGEYWSTDGGRSMYAFSRDTVTQQVGVLRIDTQTGEVRRIRTDDKIYGDPTFAFDASRNNAVAVIVSQDGQHANDVWALSPGNGELRRVTNLNPGLDSVSMGATRLIEWHDVEGRLLRGALLLPAGYREGTRVPLIAWVYASMRGSEQVNRFGLWGADQNAQMFASRGYAVLWPDIPLRRNGSPMKDIAQAVLPGLDKVVELGIADSTRLGVIGQSGGGYSTIALLVQTHRFGAAVMCAGMGNLSSFAGMMGNTGNGNWASYLEGTLGLSGPIWEYPQQYVENSPIFFLDRVTTPLMIEAGAADPSVRAFASEEIFVGLKRLGKEAVYLKYGGEDHVIMGPANVRDFWRRVTGWFGDHIGPNLSGTASP